MVETFMVKGDGLIAMQDSYVNNYLRCLNIVRTKGKHAPVNQSYTTCNTGRQLLWVTCLPHAFYKVSILVLVQLH